MYALETEAVVVPKAKSAALLQQPCSATFVMEKDHIFSSKLFDPAFRWFLQWRLLGCQISKQKQIQRDTGAVLHSVFLVEPHSLAMVRLQQRAGEERWHGTVYGPSSFWDDLQHAWHDFLSIGAPSQQEYQVVGEEEGSCYIKRTHTYTRTPFVVPGSTPDASKWSHFFGLTPGPQAVLRRVVATARDGIFRLRPNRQSASSKMFQLAFSSRSPL